MGWRIQAPSVRVRSLPARSSRPTSIAASAHPGALPAPTRSVLPSAAERRPVPVPVQAQLRASAQVGRLESLDLPVPAQEAPSSLRRTMVQYRLQERIIASPSTRARKTSRPRRQRRSGPRGPATSAVYLCSELFRRLATVAGRHPALRCWPLDQRISSVAATPIRARPLRITCPMPSASSIRARESSGDFSTMKRRSGSSLPRCHRAWNAAARS